MEGDDLEPDDTVEEPVAVQQQAASLTAEVPPADPIMTTTAKPTKSGLKCRIDVDDDCEKFVVTFDYFGESPRQSNLAAAAASASASQPQEALASAPAAVQSKITLTPEGNPRVSIAPASAPAAESALEQSATEPRQTRPHRLRSRRRRPRSSRRMRGRRAPQARCGKGGGGAGVERAGLERVRRDTRHDAAGGYHASSAPAEDRRARGRRGGSREQQQKGGRPVGAAPRLSVKLVEQVDEDQIAVSLMPNPESGAADTRLLCDASRCRFLM